MNLFSGQTQRTNEWTHCGMEILGRIERVAFRYTHTHTHTHTILCAKQVANGKLL